MDTRRTTMVFDTQRTDDYGGNFSWDLGNGHHRSGREQADPGGWYKEQGQSASLVALLKSWLRAKFASPEAAAAWERLPETLREAVEEWVRCTDLQEADKEDLRQDIYLQVVGHLENLRHEADEATLAAWAGKIAKRAAKQAAYRRKRRANHHRTNQDDCLESIIQQVHVAEADREEATRMVWDTISDLQAMGRTLSARILILHDLEKRPLHEVGTLLGLTLAQVRRRHDQAMTQFRVRFSVRARLYDERAGGLFTSSR